MPINSVQLQVKSILNGLALPGQSLPLLAYIAPPVPGEVAQTLAFIWGATANEMPQTFSRAKALGTTLGGFKKVTYNIDIWLYMIDQSDSITADSNFPLVIDAVRNAMASAQYPLLLTDPTTGQVSQLLMIGEKITTDYAPVRTLDDQQLVLYQGLLVVTVEEAIQSTTTS